MTHIIAWGSLTLLSIICLCVYAVRMYRVNQYFDGCTESYGRVYCTFCRATSPQGCDCKEQG